MHEPIAACLGDGLTARLRPLLDGETEALDAVFDGLSALSREHRYLTGLSRLPTAMRTALSTIDDSHHVGWLATVGERPAGISRYVKVCEDTAEIGFEVVDSLQGHGIGTILFDLISLSAFANGVTSFAAVVHPQNEKVVAMLRRRGIHFRFCDGLLEGVGPVLAPHLSRDLHLG